jgi:MscS family membrane protein
VDIFAGAIGRTAWAAANPASKSLVPLGGRVAKTLVVIMGIIMVVADLGYPVASLLAGLGVGGIAVALASQKTVENLFGAFSIGVDQPFRVGDFVRLDSLVGTVESLGLRSARIRTLDRTLVSIPNAKLSEMQSESYTARDRIRLACDIGVEYRTRAEQMRQILEGLSRVLREHPKFWPDSHVVRFKAFGESALVIEVMAWFTTSDWDEFTAIREQILLAFMQVVEGAGASFALPSQTVYLRQS